MRSPQKESPNPAFNRTRRSALFLLKPIGGDSVEEIPRLKVPDGPELHVWGSSEVLQALIAAGLVDEHRLWVFPVVLGKGKRLFENGVPTRGLSLVATGSTSSGGLFNTYRAAGPVPEV